MGWHSNENGYNATVVLYFQLFVGIWEDFKADACAERMTLWDTPSNLSIVFPRHYQSTAI